MQYVKSDGIIDLFDDEMAAYSRGALKVMASKYFVFWRVALIYAFSGELSRSISDEVLKQRISVVVEVLRDVVKEGSRIVDIPGMSINEMLRKLKRDSGYLTSRRLENGTYEYRVTAAARRAFTAVDDLASENTSEFSGARMQMILDQLDVIERRFTTDVGKRVEMLDARIAELEAERDKLVRDGVTEIDSEERLEQLWNLHQIMRDLPADVQSVAQKLREDGIAFRDTVVDNTSASARISAFDRSAFELLRNSVQGRSYLDAMHVLGSEEMYSIQERLEALEDAAGAESRGLVSGAWDDLMRSVEHVEDTNRVNVETLSNYVGRHATSRGRRRSELLGSAIAKSSKKTKLVCPWSQGNVMSYPKLDYVDRSKATFFAADSGVDAGNTIDIARLRELATYRTVEVLQAMVEVNPELSGNVFLCEIFNSLDKETRRLVEWGGLLVTCGVLGFVETGEATWKLVDLGGNERDWIAHDLFGDFSRISDFVRSLNV